MKPKPYDIPAIVTGIAFIGYLVAFIALVYSGALS